MQRVGLRQVVTLALAPAVLAGLLLAGGSVHAASPPTSTASAQAAGIRVFVPGQPGAVVGALSAPPAAAPFASGGFAYPADGSVVRTGSISSTATAASGTNASASATSAVTGVSLLGGEVTVGAVSVRARASAKRGRAAGSFPEAQVSGLTALGQSVASGPNVRVPLGDWGYAVVLEQAASSAGGRSFRGSVNALHVVLTADHGGLPAGSEILVGSAEAGAEAAALPPPAKPGASSKRARGQKPGSGRDEEATPRRRKREAPPVRLPPPNVSPKLTAGGYVFPVYGPVSFGDTFGAPRARVAWHHGEDIFAPLGAPVLAVADGTVFSVGWNSLGGNRLWLRDTEGNQFYYAHLSAFSPLAVNGARVRAGDVLGFVGTTGDAEGTPPHLHFEIHPVSLLYMEYDGVIKPYPYLQAWQRLEDVPLTTAVALTELGFALPILPGSAAPRPGAILLGVSDISSASGLDPGSLERAFSASLSAEDYGALALFGGLPVRSARLAAVGGEAAVAEGASSSRRSGR